jgi:hypothetical protein
VDILGHQVPPTGAIAGGETGLLAGMRALGEVRLLAKWFATFQKIELAGKLAPAAVAASGVWLLAKPNDAAIERSLTTWRTVALQLQGIRILTWADKIKAIQAAWPDGADSKAFEAFTKTVWQEMYQTENAAALIASAVQNIQSQIHQAMTTVGILVDVLLAMIIAFEIIQFANPAVAVIAQAQQGALSGVLVGVSYGYIGIATAIMIYNMGTFSGLASSGPGFPQPMPNLGSTSFTSDTDFKDIKVQNRQRKGGWTYQ